MTSKVLKKLYWICDNMLKEIIYFLLTVWSGFFFLLKKTITLICILLLAVPIFLLAQYIYSWLVATFGFTVLAIIFVLFTTVLICYEVGKDHAL